MLSKIAEAIKLAGSPVAVILSDTKPEKAAQFKERHWGCVAAMLVMVAKKRTAAFDRRTYGCVGGGVALGFGNTYEGFPIVQLLSTGGGVYTDPGREGKPVKGEYYFKSPELACKFVDSLPMREVKAEYVVFKPLEQLEPHETPETVVFFVNPDQLTALVVLANYGRGHNMNVITPYGAGCQSILYGYAEADREEPRAVIGMFDITVRRLVAPDILSFTIPWKLFLTMEADVSGSFLEHDQWAKIKERI